MDEFKGTAGKWWYDEESGAVLADNNAGPHDREVATVCASLTFGQDSANGRLLGASKDLLAALQYAVDNPEFDSTNFDTIARAAIAKATQP